MNPPHSTSDPPHRWALDFFEEDGTHLGAVPVEPDWAPAREYACFDAIRRGVLSPSTAAPTVAIEPVFSVGSGPPLCRAVRICVERHAVELPLTFFRELADRQALTWTEQGRLERGARIHFEVLAHPRTTLDPVRAADTLVLVPEGEPLPVHVVDLEVRLAQGRVQGSLDPHDVPVLVPESVLDETLACARRAGDLETGGILVGRMLRGTAGGELAVEVTAQIPARHAHARETSFAFTEQSWSDAQAAVELRDEDEIWTGWWHFHPFFCRRCPDESRAVCAYAQPFFSRDDRHLHRTCFAPGWNVALLISDLPERGLTPALFGWREGRIVPRGYHLTTQES
jgi:proteasome lid subunit RPN8/RPN11